MTSFTLSDFHVSQDPAVDRLGVALCLALVFHAALILGITFTSEDRYTAPPKLEITLAQFSSEREPEKADFLAQHDQEGSGTLDEKAMLTTRERSAFHDNTIRDVSQQVQAASKKAEARRSEVVTTRADSQHSITREREKPAPEAQHHGELELLQLSTEIASLEAKLDIQRQAYANSPRVRRLTSVATKGSADALYLHNWRSKIEAIGNRNYPEEARRQEIYGDLRMMVSLLPNGEVNEVKILQSSGQRVLDEAAIRIVHLAAPYAPFPGEMRGQVDVLEIIRTWRFHKDRLTSSS